MGWFLRGTLFGPAFGPLLSGIIVTYTSWRVIFWLQTAMTGVCLLLSVFVMHETLRQPRYVELRGKGFGAGAAMMWQFSSPGLVLKLLGERNLLFVVSCTIFCPNCAPTANIICRVSLQHRWHSICTRSLPRSVMS